MEVDVTWALKTQLAAELDDVYAGAPGDGEKADLRDLTGVLSRFLATCQGTHGWEATGPVDLNTAIWQKLKP